MSRKEHNQNSRAAASMVLGGSLEGSEIVIGLVDAVGSNHNQIIKRIKDCIRSYNYKLEEVSISEAIIPSILNYLDPDRKRGKSGEFARIKNLMDGGNIIRKLMDNNAILAYGAVSRINLLRQQMKEKHKDQWPGYSKQTIYVIKTLKRPEEVDFLRKIYGPGFYLLGIYTEESRRLERLKEKGLTEKQALLLSQRDSNDNEPAGQRASDTYHLADFFLRFGDSEDQLRRHVRRIFRLMFGHPNLTPEFDEYAMFMAFAASLRSADLSRQVGAVIARGEEILGSGANDSPKAGGGLYWSRSDLDANGTDFAFGFDSNSKQKRAIIQSIVTELQKEDVDRSRAEAILRSSQLSEITEYGRSVHAEMEALLSCARVGTSTKDATLYCTTFPCHNCAKHIVAAGIRRVVYVEPYPKSKAMELHSDSITTDLTEASTKVMFEPFTGVGARRFFDLFSMRLGAGSHLERKDCKGDAIAWEEKRAEPRITLSPASYIDLEMTAQNDFITSRDELEKKLGKKLVQARKKDIEEFCQRINND